MLSVIQIGLSGPCCTYESNQRSTSRNAGPARRFRSLVLINIFWTFGRLIAPMMCSQTSRTHSDKRTTTNPLFNRTMKVPTNHLCCALQQDTSQIILGSWSGSQEKCYQAWQYHRPLVETSWFDVWPFVSPRMCHTTVFDPVFDCFPCHLCKEAWASFTVWFTKKHIDWNDFKLYLSSVRRSACYLLNRIRCLKIIERKDCKQTAENSECTPCWNEVLWVIPIGRLPWTWRYGTYCNHSN